MKSIKLLLSILIILILIIESCDRIKVISACGCDDPKNDLEWLKETLPNYLIVEIYVYYHEGIEYIAISNEGIQTDPLDINITFFDCSGVYICTKNINYPKCEIQDSPREYLFSYRNPIIDN